MTDRRRLELFPLPGQMETAVRLVHRRRRRSALTGASAVTASVVLALGLSLAQPGGSAGLRPADPAGSDTVTASPGIRRSVGEASVTGPRWRGTAPASPNARREPETSFVTTTVPPPSASADTVAPTAAPSPTATGASRARLRPRPRMEREGPYDVGPTTPDNKVTCAVGPWCGTARVSELDGGRIAFSYTVCRQYGSETGRLAFDTTLETEFTVVGADGQERWRWSDGQRFSPSDELLYVDAAWCVQWWTTWDGVLDDGSRLGVGTYELVAASASEPGPPRVTAAFRI